MSNHPKRGIADIIDDISINDVDDFYQRELKRVLDDKGLLSQLKQRGISPQMVDGNLGNILDFEESHQRCQMYHQQHGDEPCGTQIVELTVIDGEVVRQLGQCPHQLKRDQHRGRYVISDFDHHWMNRHLSDVDVQRHRAPYLSELLSIVKGENKWVYVFGPSGRGKAYMSVCALNELAETNKNATFAFVDFPSFVSENMVDFFANRATVDRMINVLSEVDYLVINRFGNEEMSELVRSSITMPLLSNRDSKRKVTIILASVGLEELEGLHKGGKNNQIRAEQLTQIIKDNIKTPIYLSGAKIY